MCQMNMFLVQSVLKSEGAAGSQVMLFDKHPDGPYMELIEKAFSPGGPVIRPSHYRGKKVDLLFLYSMYVCTCLFIYTCRLACMYVCIYVCICGGLYLLVKEADCVCRWYTMTICM